MRLQMVYKDKASFATEVAKLLGWNVNHYQRAISHFSSIINWGLNTIVCKRGIELSIVNESGEELPLVLRYYSSEVC